MSTNTAGFCPICGEWGAHGNLPCPRMQTGTPGSYSYQSPIDYGPKLDRIIELLEQLLRRDHD